VKRRSTSERGLTKDETSCEFRIGWQMRAYCLLMITLLFSDVLQAQYRADRDKESRSVITRGNHQQLQTTGKSNYSFSRSILGSNSSQGTFPGKYGDVRNEAAMVNKQYPWWGVALKVTGANILTFAVDRYLLNYEYSRIGFNSWSDNLKNGWEWDVDRFGMNFIIHPYSGSVFYNAGRSSGYNFWESAPFAALGSLQWEYFGENTPPAYNDIVNTTINGIFLGEVAYRIGSHIIDDQSTGMERFAREFSVFLLSPTRTFSRLIEGNLFRVTSEGAGQKEPLNMTLSTGMRRVNEGPQGSSFWTGPTDFWVNVHLDNGNPFEVISRKPFDYFKVRISITKVSGRKILDNVTGYGLLFGKNLVPSGSMEILVGGFQHFNYFDNKTFELATIAFGPGIATKLPIGSTSILYTNLHIAVVPLAGNSTFYGPDTTQFRDYNYGGGAEAKLESTLNLGSWVSFTFIGYYFWVHTYVGHTGDHLIGLVKPRVTLRLFSNLSIGVEHSAYYSDRYTNDYGNFHKVRTEQKVFLSLYLESFKHGAE